MLETVNTAVASTTARGRRRLLFLPVTVQLLLAASLAALVVTDWMGGIYWTPGRPDALGTAKLIGALLCGSLAVVSPRLGDRSLPAIAAVFAVASLCFSAAMHLVLSVGSQAFGFAEPAALVWLLLLVARRGSPRGPRWPSLCCSWRSCCGRCRSR